MTSAEADGPLIRTVRGSSLSVGVETVCLGSFRFYRVFIRRKFG